MKRLLQATTVILLVLVTRRYHQHVEHVKWVRTLDMWSTPPTVEDPTRSEAFAVGLGQ